MLKNTARLSLYSQTMMFVIFASGTKRTEIRLMSFARIYFLIIFVQEEKAFDKGCLTVSMTKSI